MPLDFMVCYQLGPNISKYTCEGFCVIRVRTVHVIEADSKTQMWDSLHDQRSYNIARLGTVNSVPHLGVH